MDPLQGPAVDIGAQALEVLDGQAAIMDDSVDLPYIFTSIYNTTIGSSLCHKYLLTESS